jgi:hypothetical protein
VIMPVHGKLCYHRLWHVLVCGMHLWHACLYCSRRVYDEERLYLRTLCSNLLQ